MTLILVAGFILGRWHGILTKGYVYRIRERQTHDSPSGSVEWRHVTKHVGWELMDTGTTELEYDGRLLYSATRDFQEDRPFASDIRFDGKRLEWDDGDYFYSLEIEASRHNQEPVRETGVPAVPSP